MDDTQRMGIESMRQARKHIVVINAEPLFLDVARELLQMERFNVTTTTYLPHTFDAILGFDPSLIILDVLYGEIAGWSMLESLANDALTRDIPVIITSPQQELLDRAKLTFSAVGHHRFVIVPLDLEELVCTVNQLIGTA